MKKKTAPRFRKHLKKYRKHLGFVTLFLLFAVVFLAFVLTGSYLTSQDLSKPTIGEPGIPVTPSLTGSEQNLQLKTFTFATPAPAKCQFDSEKTGGCTCPDTQYFPPYYTDKPEEICSNAAPCDFMKACDTCGWNNSYCDVPTSLTGNPINGSFPKPPGINCLALKAKLDTGGTYCVGKPVIYLYPEKPTSVDVTLTIPGEIYISIPSYPQSGWKNVLAEPDGTLTYQGKTYHELYYESKVNTNLKPAGGIIIPMSELSGKLSELTGKLGLKSSEQKEFLAYWLPKLEELQKPYILFSVLTSVQKESVDHVEISPKPDTFINFLAYFKGLDFPVETQPLVIPAPTKRTGFTAVEWGGTIDR